MIELMPDMKPASSHGQFDAQMLRATSTLLADNPSHFITT